MTYVAICFCIFYFTILIFTHTLTCLQLLEYRIQRGGLNCVKLSGSLSLEQRDKALKAFREDPQVKVLLISLKAGGVALNLTVANRIFLMGMIGLFVCMYVFV
ncbi:DEAD/DEAH box helicase [archaeon]|nr:MAG: DEAD/DEAH box helicase [archaeon]